MVEIGLYRHYKGDYYFVEGSSTNPDTDEEIVHYRDAAGAWQHRPMFEFTGSVEVESKGLIDGLLAVPRYEKIYSRHHQAEPRFG